MELLVFRTARDLRTGNRAVVLLALPMRLTRPKEFFCSTQQILKLPVTRNTEVSFFPV